MRFPKVYDLRRAVIDYHVDRTDVEAQRCVELTVTNSPFGLTIKFTTYIEHNFLSRLPINIPALSSECAALKSGATSGTSFG